MKSSRITVASLWALASLAACGGDPGIEEPEPLATRSAAVSAAPLGATPHAQGTWFRVWAPKALRVWVAGEWSGFAEDVDPLAPASDGSGVWAASIRAARPGHGYRYVIEASDGTKKLKVDPRVRAAVDSKGPGLVVDPGAYRWRVPAFTPPPRNQQVIYEMHVGTFNDLPGGAPGTFASAVERLDHLVALGVNMIELMPPAEFSGAFSWGYNPALPFATESAYGTHDDMKRFVDEAHARGIGVIVDVVHNHWGPQDQPMWCFDGDCLGAGGIYFYTDARGKTPWGPRPDYGRPEVRAFIRDNAVYWLTELRADGLRWDSTINMRKAGEVDLPDGWRLLRAMTDEVAALSPKKLLIAEDLRVDSWITRPTSRGGAGFDTQWDAAFFHPVNDTIVEPADAARRMSAVRDAVVHRPNGSAWERVIYTESHDEVANGRQRIPAMIDKANPASWKARKRSTLGAAIVLTAPGVPMLFQGQELLEDGWFQDTRPLDWSRAQTHAGVLKLYRDLIALRRGGQGRTRGLMGNNVNAFHVNEAGKVLAYHRWDAGGPGDDVLVIANFAGRAFPSYQLGAPRAGVWRVRLNSDARAYGADFTGVGGTAFTAAPVRRDGLAHTITVALGPYSVLVLSQD